MAKDDSKPLVPKPPEDDSSELGKFKRLAMRVISVPKDAVYVLDPKMKPKTKPKRKATKKAAKKSSPKK